MPIIHRGCRGLPTAKKEAIVLKLIEKELVPFIEIIQRHQTFCHQKCYDIRNLCREYRAPGQFAGRSTIERIDRMSDLLSLGEDYVDMVMSGFIEFIIAKLRRYEEESMKWNAEHNNIVESIKKSPNSVLRDRIERQLVEFLRESLPEQKQREHDFAIWTSMISELKLLCIF
jgi:hypothetical protein